MTSRATSYEVAARTTSSYDVVGSTGSESRLALAKPTS